MSKIQHTIPHTKEMFLPTASISAEKRANQVMESLQRSTYDPTVVWALNDLTNDELKGLLDSLKAQDQLDDFFFHLDSCCLLGHQKWFLLQRQWFCF